MNYIKKLENENKEKAAEIVGLRALIQDLKEHIELPKFQRPDNWINTDDVQLFIEQGLSRVDALIEDQKYLNLRNK